MHLDSGHPIRVLLRMAASGQLPSRELLDKMQALPLPDGQSLAKFRTQINAEARCIRDLHSEGNHDQAREHADQVAFNMADQMTAEQRALDTLEPGPESLHDIGERMFRH